MFSHRINANWGFSEKLVRIGFDMDALKATGAAKYSRPGTRPSPALSGVGPEAENRGAQRG